MCATAQENHCNTIWQLTLCVLRRPIPTPPPPAPFLLKKNGGPPKPPPQPPPPPAHPHELCIVESELSWKAVEKVKTKAGDLCHRHKEGRHTRPAPPDGRQRRRQCDQRRVPRAGTQMASRGTQRHTQRPKNVVRGELINARPYLVPLVLRELRSEIHVLPFLSPPLCLLPLYW